MEAVEGKNGGFLDDFSRQKDICDFLATIHVCTVIRVNVGKH